MSAKVVSLQLHEGHGAHPRLVREVTARVGGGIEGDSHVDRAERAVVVLDRSALDALGLAFGDLREQVTIEGLPDVSRLEPGTAIRIGAVTLRVNSECEPCTHIGAMNGQADVLAFQAALEGRRGAICTVLAAQGPIRIGDQVEVLVPA
jgi:MOSC domain-containing protein YiiM